MVGERSEPAATRMHLWLERTAFYKVPKSHQDEVAEQCHKPFEQVERLMPSSVVCKHMCIIVSIGNQLCLWYLCMLSGSSEKCNHVYWWSYSTIK